MRYEYQDPASGGQFLMAIQESQFERNFFQDSRLQYNAILWNKGESQRIVMDGMTFELPKNAFMSMNVSHTFRLERSEEVVIWQFNKEFYCIVTHDAEVSCTGLLFYGWREGSPIFLGEKESRSIHLLVEVFQDEFQNRDNIQGEMLRVLLKRLIIKLTRLLKEQAGLQQWTNSDLDLVRQFNLLVENNFKKMHQVQDYANLMYKSPKTLSNLFSKNSQKTPLQIISDRIFLESKRLMLYTNLSTGEISQELGFTEAAHFSRFFKKMSGQTPSAFKKPENNHPPLPLQA